MKVLLFSLMVLLCLSCKKAHPSRLPDHLAQIQPTIHRDYQLPMTEQRVSLTKAYFKEHNLEWFKQIAELEGLEALTFKPRLVVVHYTAQESLQETLDYFQPPVIASDRGKVAAAAALNVGIQFLVDRDGQIYSHYPENATSRHTIGLNHVAIGIENVGDADLGAVRAGKLPLTEAQLEANYALICYLAHKYPSLDYVIGHSEYRELEEEDHPAHHLFVEDIPTYRTDKVDPGPRFMQALREKLAEGK